MDTLRLFVGTTLDLAATRRVAEVAAGLRARLERDGWAGAWVPAPNLHITLKFLGETDAALVDALGAALAGVAARTPEIPLHAAGVGCFPDVGPPRVIFLRVATGEAALVVLAARIESALGDLGFAPEARAFRPHVTLARVRAAPPGVHALPAAALERGATDAGAGVLRELALYRSDVLRAGVEYHALSRHRLGIALDR